MTAQIIQDFWNAMGTNDFDFAATFLHPDFEYFMPQTNEYLAGRDMFAKLNAAYPTEGKWGFTVQSIIADGDDVVSDVKITDGRMDAHALTFHTLQDGLILRQKEFWPDTYPAPAWRAPWMKVLPQAPF